MGAGVTEKEALLEIEAESSDAIAELKMKFRDKTGTPLVSGQMSRPRCATT